MKYLIVPGDNRSFSPSCRNVVFSLVLTAILLQLVHYSRTPEQGDQHYKIISEIGFQIGSYRRTPKRGYSQHRNFVKLIFKDE